MQKQISFELYADQKKTKHSNNPNDTFRSTKKFYEKPDTKKKPPKLPLANFLAKEGKEEISQMKNFPFARRKFL